MNLYENCATCKGQGTLPCDECKCLTCKATGKVDLRCSTCQSGKVTCDKCSGTGKLLEKKGWFSDKYSTCYRCDGSGKKTCPSCHGTTLVKGNCSSCVGSGRNAGCPTCGGKAKVTCASCNGVGRFEGPWVKSLDSMPVDRLRFEFEKRQREISNLQQEITIAEQELEEINEAQQDAYAHRQPDYSAAGFNKASSARMSGIMYTEDRVKELRAQMNAIERVLDKKWK